ncbi:MAG: DNA-binding response regulator [Terriglobia bacterium]|nr:MAG: DNA-binding response regulator [Terriglobia bacterium]
MRLFSAVIADDEGPSRRRIRQLLAGEPDFQVIGEASNGRHAVDLLRRSPPDVLFLDVQIPELDGFGILEAIGPKLIPAVVFVTAYDKYAIRAFEVHALDYLLKPFDRERFREAVELARTRVTTAQAAELSDKLRALLAAVTPSPRERIVIKDGGRVTLLDAATIDWIEAADNYACLHCGDTRHVIRETMNALEARLDRRTFVRIHRSFIVNIDRIAQMQPWFRGDYLVFLRDGTKLRLSRSYRDSLNAFLTETSPAGRR